MKIKKLLVAAFFLSISIGSFALLHPDGSSMNVDHKCKNDCSQRGYSWDYCERICSY